MVKEKTWPMVTAVNVVTHVPWWHIIWMYHNTRKRLNNTMVNYDPMACIRLWPMTVTWSPQRKKKAVDWEMMTIAWNIKDSMHNDRHGHSHVAGGCPGQEECWKDMRVTSPHPWKQSWADQFGGPQSAIDLEKFTHRGRGLQAAMAMHEIPVHLPMP